MTISVSSLFTPQTPTQWLSTLLGDGSSLGLAATAWQDGQVVRTVVEIVALELAKEDAYGISLRAQGGFLDFAASGSVTFTDFDGQTVTSPVTPDPSIPSQNSTGAPGLLDTLASSVYNVTRIQATSATNPIYLSNTSGVSIGSFPAGTFHVQNGFTGATYSNTTSFTLSASSKIGTSVTGATTASPVVVTTSASHGLSTGAVVYAQSLTVVPDNFYTITVVDSTHFSLNGTVGTSTFNPSAQPPPNCWTAVAVVFQADQLGTYGNAAVNNINQLITSAPKCFCTNLVTFAGTPWQSNSSLAALCRAKLATISVAGPAGAYYAFALLAQNILLNEPIGTTFSNSVINPSVSQLTLTSPLPTNVTLDGGAITKALVSQNPASGAATVTVANATGPVGGCMNLAITAATTASPIVITTASPHNCLTGDYVQVNGVQGLSGANGTFLTTKVSANQLSLNGSTGSGSYTSGGQLSGGDLYAVSAVLAAYVEPLAVTMSVQSATAVPTTVAATVYVPKAFVSDYTTKMTAAITAYFASFPIGGLNVDGASNVLPIGAVEGVLFASGQTSGQIYTLSVASVTLNGSPFDLPLSATGVAQLGSLAAITVIGQ